MSSIIVHVIFLIIALKQCQSCCPQWQNKQNQLKSLNRRINKAVCEPEIRWYRYHNSKCWGPGGNVAKWLCAWQCQGKCHVRHGSKISCSTNCGANKIVCHCKRGCAPATHINTALSLFNKYCIRPRPKPKVKLPRRPKPPPHTARKPVFTKTIRITQLKMGGGIVIQVVPLYQIYSKKYLDYAYTIHVSQIAKMIQSVGSYEILGSVGYLISEKDAKEKCPNAKTLMHMVDTKTNHHHYTTSIIQKATWTKKGMKFIENAGMCAKKMKDCGSSVALNRYVSVKKGGTDLLIIGNKMTIPGFKHKEVLCYVFEDSSKKQCEPVAHDEKGVKVSYTRPTGKTFKDGTLAVLTCSSNDMYLGRIRCNGNKGNWQTDECQVDYCSGTTVVCTAKTIPLYQYFSAVKTDHFYIPNPTQEEREGLKSDGYADGHAVVNIIDADMGTKQCKEAVPLYCMKDKKAKNTILTADKAEKNKMASQKDIYEECSKAIVGYCVPSAKGDKCGASLPLLRYQSTLKSDGRTADDYYQTGDILKLSNYKHVKGTVCNVWDPYDEHPDSENVEVGDEGRSGSQINKEVYVYEPDTNVDRSLQDVLEQLTILQEQVALQNAEEEGRAAENNEL